MDHSQQQAEIDRLMSSLIDGDQVECTAAGAAIEALLTNNPQLQAYYADAMLVQLTLMHGMQLGQLPAAVVPATAARRAGGLPAELASKPTDSPSVGGQPLVQQQPATTPASGRQGQQWLSYALALSVAAVLCGAAWSWLFSDFAIFPLVAKAPESVRPVETPFEVAGGGDNTLRLNSVDVLATVSRLTQTPQINSLTLPRRLEGPTPSLTPCSGVAVIRRSHHPGERGYLVALDPGWRMELSVDAEATAHNMLSMVEFDVSGRVTGSWVSFHNLVQHSSGQKTFQRRGVVGEHAEVNNSTQTKYYLLAAAHVPGDAGDDDAWRQSDCKVRLSSNRLLVLGWDDSGGIDNDAEHPDPSADYDYNDVVATIYLSPIDKTLGAEGLELSPPPVEMAAIGDASPPIAELGAGCTIDVMPGETVAIAVNSYATWQNSLQIIDTQDKLVVWTDVGVPWIEDQPQPTDRGVYSIVNNTPLVRRYELLGRHLRPSSAKAGSRAPQWQVTDYRIISEKQRHTIIGFEDDPANPRNVDWQDLYITVQRFRPK
jgi:hypothetical protein